MAFIEAVLNANKELFHALHVKGLIDKDYQPFEVGAGGDISSGIDLLAEEIFVRHLNAFGTIYS